MTFQHLHPVDTAIPFAFFVHHCSPQQNIPQLQIQPNTRLPELVAAMVQNGPVVSRKAAEKAEKIIAKLNEATDNTTNNSTDDQTETNEIIVNYEENAHKEDINEQIQPVCVEVLGSTPVDPVEPIKLETYLTDPQYAQFVLNAPQFDFTDQVLMYQPFVLDVPQFIALAPTNMTQQFLHIQPKTESSHQGGQIL